jgi:hypothetical protein
VVNPSGVVVPMVGWKQAPLSAVTSRFPVSDKYFHTLCNTMDVMIECMCLWLSFTVFEQLLEILICFCKLIFTWPSIYLSLAARELWDVSLQESWGRIN